MGHWHKSRVRFPSLNLPGHACVGRAFVPEDQSCVVNTKGYPRHPKKKLKNKKQNVDESEIWGQFKGNDEVQLFILFNFLVSMVCFMLIICLLDNAGKFLRSVS